MNKYCKCKIQIAPIYKKIKGVFYFVCHRCRKIRNAKKKWESGSFNIDGDCDYLTVSDSADWDLGLGDFTIGMMIIRNNDGTIRKIKDV